MPRKSVTRAAEIFRQEGTISLSHSILRSSGVWNAVTSRYPIGTNVFDRDWDLLVVLDACRTDVLRETTASKDYVNDVGRMWSVGSMTAEWVLKTFHRSRSDVIGDTAVVAGNGWYDNILRRQYHDPDEEKTKYDDESDAEKYEKIYNGYPGWDVASSDRLAHFEPISVDPETEHRLHPDNPSHTPALTTDRAIAIAREHSPDRLLVHYVLPHTPFVADAVAWDPGETPTDTLMNGLKMTRSLRPEDRGFDMAKRGEISTEELRQKYRRNVRLALEYVEILLRNVDAERAVISADHGEALGEYGLYGHPYCFFLPPVKTVPWAPTSATDEKTYEPQHGLEGIDRETPDNTDFLKDMGYI
jgi:hypothetical protein